ncbi:hypothetical protein CD134_05960 [Staphylococcus lutrae]|nr:hypothetical protein CD134_05960 [Staphylococcus lutrae]
MSSKGIKVMRVAASLVMFACCLCTLIMVILGYFFDWHVWMITLMIVFGLVALVQGVLFVWLRPVYLYRTFRYRCEPHLVTVRKGFIFIKQQRIPMFRIQGVDINEGWLMRKYQLASLKLLTAGGNTTITLIDKAMAQEMMRFIKQHNNSQPTMVDKETLTEDDNNEGQL